MYIIWKKSSEYVITGKASIPSGVIIEADELSGRALIRAGWTETRSKPTHEWSDEKQAYIKIEK